MAVDRIDDHHDRCGNQQLCIVVIAPILIISSIVFVVRIVLLAGDQDTDHTDPSLVTGSTCGGTHRWFDLAGRHPFEIG